MEVDNIGEYGNGNGNRENIGSDRNGGGEITASENNGTSTNDTNAAGRIGFEDGNVTIEIPQRTAKRGRPTGSGNRSSSNGSGSSRTGSSRTGTEEETPFLVLDDPPIDAKFNVEKTRKPRQTAASKISSDDVAQLVAVLFLMFAMSKPPVLRPVWEYDTEDCANVAIPLAKIINRMPVKAVSTLQNLTDPITLIVALMAMISNSREREAQIVKTIRERQAENAVNGTGNVTFEMRHTENPNRHKNGESNVEDVTTRRFDIPFQNE